MGRMFLTYMVTPIPPCLCFPSYPKTLWMYYIYKLKLDWHIHKHLDLGEKKMRLIPSNWGSSLSMSCVCSSLSCHFQSPLLPKNYWTQPMKKLLLMWNITRALKSAEQVKTNPKKVKCSNDAETESIHSEKNSVK